MSLERSTHVEMFMGITSSLCYTDPGTVARGRRPVHGTATWRGAARPPSVETMDRPAILAFALAPALATDAGAR